MADEPSSDGAPLPPPKHTRLSDHFHKVRLTSLFLSVLLFLISSRVHMPFVMGPGSAKWPDEEHLPFIVAALFTAATVTLGHVWVMWRGEVAELDPQITGGTFERELTAFVKKADALIGTISEADQKLEKDVRELSARPPGLDHPAIREKFNELYPAHLPDVSNVVDRALVKSVYFNFALSDGDDKFVGASIEDFEARVSSEGLFDPEADNRLMHAKDLHTEVVRELLERLRKSLSNASQDVQVAVRDYLQRWVEEMKPHFMQALVISESSAAATLAEMENLQTTVARNRQAVIQDIRKIRDELHQAQRPLRKHTTYARTQIYAFDMFLPISLYGLAALHALGVLVGNLFWSLPRALNEGRAWLMTLDWPLRLLTILAIFGAILAVTVFIQWRFRARRRAMVQT